MASGTGKSYEQTDLWRVFKEKASQEELGDDFINGVGKICEKGGNLSKTVIEFFPTFTLHDETHLSNVSLWMWRLLGDYAQKLTAKEAAYLLMSAWCHDIGMEVSKAEKDELLEDLDTKRWSEYFDAHPDAQREYDKTGSVSGETLRDFIRTCHAQRSGEKIREMEWPPALTRDGGLLQDAVADLCASHGLTLEDVRLSNDSLRRCAALLRLADLLDYDASRAPADLFAHMGLDSPSGQEERRSREEWDKNRSGGFKSIENGIVHYHVYSDSLQLEMEIRRYVGYVKAELGRCNDFLSGRGDWEGFSFPTDIQITIQPNGYKSGDFRITMDQDRVLQLLTGRNLYSNAGVFVRELLQNSIDAVLTRRRVDPDFGRDRRSRKPSECPGKILVDTWSDNGYDWFRIEDDGIGMTEEIITSYFLKVGCSYYTSEEFKAEQRYAESEYTPISRFGIGVLSCFMADPENALLEVSAQRYYTRGIAPPPAIRLTVDGLHGYYYLFTDEKGGHAKPMPRPKNEADKGFRTKPGTTICVRTNLRHLGGYASFREILDEYIRFPEVEIEHCTWDGSGAPDRKNYPTQQEFMRLLHERNPDGPDKPLKEYVYPFSDSLYEKVRKLTPEFRWEKRPELVLRFQPLDWLDESGNLNGCAISMDFRCEAYSEFFDFAGQSIRAELDMKLDLSRFPTIKFRGSFPEEIADKIESILDVWEYASKEIFKKSDVYSGYIEQFHQEYPYYGNDAPWKEEWSKRLKTLPKELDAKYRQLHEKVEEASALHQQYDKALTHFEHLRQEKMWTISTFVLETMENDPLLRLLTPPMKERIRSHPVMFASCNGIAIPNFQDSRRNYFTLFLLSGSYRPELNLARNVTSSLPPEAFYALSHVSVDLFRYGNNYFRNSILWLLPERNFQQMWERHPSWEPHLSCGRYLREGKDWEGKRIYVFSGCPLKQLPDFLPSVHAPVAVDFFQGVGEVFGLPALAVAKGRFEVRREFNPRGFCYVSPGKTDCRADDFPPEMFFVPYESCSALGYITEDGRYNYYNCEHTFSRWLIANGEAMRKERRADAIFRRLLEDMLTITERKDLVKAIALALDDLKRLLGNPFSISGELYVSEDSLLTASDFKTKEFDVQDYTFVEAEEAGD